MERHQRSLRHLLHPNAKWRFQPGEEGDGVAVKAKHLIVLCVISIALLVTCEGPTESRRKEPPKIVFTSERDSVLTPLGGHRSTEIYIMDIDGSNQTRLTNNETYDRSLQISPNGSKIIFVSYESLFKESYRAEINIIDTDGTNEMRLTDAMGDDIHPQFSPDGSRIVFESARDGDREIYMMDVDGDNQTNLTNNPKSDIHPRFSCGGSKVVFSSNRFVSWSTYIMDLDGSNQTKVILFPLVFSCSQDGLKIVYSRDGDIYTMDTDGSNYSNITNNSSRDRSPQFSPDGTMIAFHSERDRNSEVYIMDRDGSNQTNLTNRPEDDILFEFSPDGTQILFALIDFPNRDIYIVDIDGSNLTRLTDYPGWDWEPHFLSPP